MMDLDRPEQSTLANMSNKKMELLSTALERTTQWILSLEVPSDVTVNTSGSSLSLHKFPLISKCGYIRKMLSKPTSIIEIPDVPGGAEAFEIAAKFCYGTNFMITAENVAMLRCAAEYLEMTDEYAVGNLVSRTEAYINEVALRSISGSVSVLHCCESLFPTAEEVKLVSRCVDAIALLACEDSRYGTPMWAEDLAILRIDMLRRVVVAMVARGLKQHILGPVLVLYTQKSLRGLEVFGKGNKKIDPRQEHEKRAILETIVSLLPREKNAVPVSFLSMLLRAAKHLQTTVACRVDLEMRIASQLGQAVLDDLLIPSYPSFNCDTLFDVEAVKRIMVNFSVCEKEVKRMSCDEDRDCGEITERVAGLMESYLCEISSDPNLSVSKFISVAELIPEQGRVTEDGMYKAIDTYLKAHPALSEIERRNICTIMDCQKLSREARAHVVQNARLPVQTVVQVLYHEQHRLRQALGDTLSQSPALPSTLDHYSINVPPITNEVSFLRRENQDLKLELMKIKTRLKNMQKSSRQLPAAINPIVTSIQKHPLPWKSLISSVSRRLGKFSIAESYRGKDVTSKHRRHSVS